MIQILLALVLLVQSHGTDGVEVVRIKALPEKPTQLCRDIEASTLTSAINALQDAGHTINGYAQGQEIGCPIATLFTFTAVGTTTAFPLCTLQNFQRECCDACLSAADDTVADDNGARKPVVVGTTMLVEAEQKELPLFIDAFLNAEKSSIYVVFSLTHMERAGNLSEWGKWTCAWSTAEPASSSFLRQDSDRLLASTNLEVNDGTWLTLDSDDAPLNESKASDVEDTSLGANQVRIRTIVVSCPAPADLDSLQTARLDLEAVREGSVPYRHSGIKVEASSFLQDAVDFALCTMVNNGEGRGPEYLQPWVEYHIGLGFKQLLVYVEAADVSWVSDALGRHIKNGNVVLIPFYFGGMSDRGEFLLQGAMESHCLYQAKGRAKWLGHADIDEYFDIRALGDGQQQTLDSVFSSLRETDAIFSVRSVFWGWGSTSPQTNKQYEGPPFPCNLTIRNEVYFPGGTRSKIIMRPESVFALFPHEGFVKKGSQTRIANPNLEMRLNHYKRCTVHGNSCYSGCAIASSNHASGSVGSCIEDTSFQTACTRFVRQEDLPALAASL